MSDPAEVVEDLLADLLRRVGRLPLAHESVELLGLHNVREVGLLIGHARRAHRALKQALR